MLDAEETGRRIRAARELRGVSQDELAQLLAADGLGRWDAGRIERGSLPMRRVHQEALARNLEVPSEWFSLPDIGELWAAGEATPDGRLDVLLEEVRLLRSTMAIRDQEALARYEGILSAIPGAVRSEMRR